MIYVLSALCVGIMLIAAAMTTDLFTWGMVAWAAILVGVPFTMGWVYGKLNP